MASPHLRVHLCVWPDPPPHLPRLADFEIRHRFSQNRMSTVRAGLSQKQRREA
jgi:hypothetical protein